MNQLQLQQIIENMRRLSQEFSHRDFENVISQNPNLTVHGLYLPHSKSFTEDRKELSKYLQEFQYCCAYLSLFQRSKRPCKEAFHSGYLKHHIERLMKSYVPSGCIVAACDCLGIKYWSDPKNTPYVKPYIKSELPVPVEVEYLV